MHKLNHRPRKTLNFKTPHEVFSAEQEKEAARLLGLHFEVESASYLKLTNSATRNPRIRI